MSLLLFCFLTNCNPPAKKEDHATETTTARRTDREILGEAHARKQVLQALKSKGYSFASDSLIKDPAMAIAVAEPILFDVYGKEKILEERPYKIYVIDGYWYIAGTIPNGSSGGAFEIILSSRDSKIIRLTHYK